MKSVKEYISEAIVKHNIKNVNKKSNIENFKSDLKNFKLYQNKHSKKNITKEWLAKTTYIIYNITSLEEFMKLRNKSDENNYIYAICYWKNLGPKSQSYWCLTYLDNNKAKIKFYDNNAGFELKYKNPWLNNDEHYLNYDDLKQDYEDNIHEIIILEFER